MSRAYTTEEVQEQFLAHVRQLCFYWQRQSADEKSKLDGLAFSILAAIDGSSGLPKFALIPDPHPDDKAFHEAEDSDYYKPMEAVAGIGDISGDLHELFYKK